jgi:Tol biopolymer transport system component
VVMTRAVGRAVRGAERPHARRVPCCAAISLAILIVACVWAAMWARSPGEATRTEQPASGGGTTSPSSPVPYEMLLGTYGVTITVSPEGGRVAHEVVSDTGGVALGVTTLPEGGGPLTPRPAVYASGAPGYVRDPAYSPDGALIAYTVTEPSLPAAEYGGPGTSSGLSRTGAECGLWVVPAPPHGQPPTLRAPSATQCALLAGARWPRWRNDGQAIAFSFTEADGRLASLGLVRMRGALAGGPPAVLASQPTRPGEGYGRVDWVLNGREIVYSSAGPAGDVGLWCIDPATTVVRNLTSGTWDIGPVSSQDGHWVAYRGETDRREGPVSIFVVRALGGSPVRVSGTELRCWPPAWSPDGNRMAFIATDVADQHQRRHIYVATAPEGGWGQEGADVVSIPGADSPLGQVAWLPDGTRIVWAPPAGPHRGVAPQVVSVPIAP